MRRITAVTALSVAGVLLAAGTAAALNAQVLGGPTRTSVGTADTLLPDDPFASPTVDETGTVAPTDEASESAEPSEKPSAKPSASKTSRPVSPSTVPSTGGGSTTEPGDNKGGDSGNSGSGSDNSGSGSSGSGGSDDDKPDDD